MPLLVPSFLFQVLQNPPQAHGNQSGVFRKMVVGFNTALQASHTHLRAHCVLSQESCFMIQISKENAVYRSGQRR